MKLKSRAAVKFAQFTSRLIKKLGKGGGAVFPGLVARIISPGLLSEMSSMIKGKRVAVMGTNGKTGTNALIYKALTDLGYKVVTNATGANMYNGVLSAFVLAADKNARLDADFACIEVDEIAAAKVLPDLKPDCVLLTNISADQSDRLGGADAAAAAIKSAFDKILSATLILNADDPISCALKYECKNPSVTFGISSPIFQNISGTCEKEAPLCPLCGSKLQYKLRHYGVLGIYSCPACNFCRPSPDCTIGDASCKGGAYDFTFGEENIHSHAGAAYTIYNTLSAYSALKAMGAPLDKFEDILKSFDFGNGREKTYNIAGKDFRLHLAKNPEGIRQKISLILNDPNPKDIVVAINDYPADGEDISWIWDANFQDLKGAGAASIVASGTRYCDVGLRFKYEDIPFETEKDLKKALLKLLSGGTDNIYIIVNYSNLLPAGNILNAMLSETKGGGGR